MPELRTDRLTGRTVLVAENRAHRPNEFACGPSASDFGELPSGLSLRVEDSRAATGLDCPFCAGNESRTPPAVYELPDGAGGWRVRVVPNMYPAVTLGDCPLFLPPEEVGRQCDKQEKATVPLSSSHLASPALGAHEVIIESPRHVDRISALSVPDFRHVLAAYARRLRHWQGDGRFNYALVFKNQGPRAGASMAHVHSQLIALPQVPPMVERELDRAKRLHEKDQVCPYCQLIDEERSCGARLVLDRDGYVAFCPFASLQPMEVWLMPAVHEPAFERPAPSSALDRLAAVLHGLIGKLEAAVPGAAYNLSLRTAPWRDAAATDPWFHWRIELLPRVTPLAGLELAAGVHINPLPPEQAARRLRDGPAFY